MLELDRVRRVEAALIARVAAFGRLESLEIFASKRNEVTWVLQNLFGARLKRQAKFAEDQLPEMPEAEPQHTAEAIRRALPALSRLKRYEARAAAKPDRATRELAQNAYRLIYTT